MCFKYQQFQKNPNSPFHNSTRDASIQGEATHKGDTSEWSRRHHLDNKATPSRRSNTPINNQKTLYGWLGKTFRVSGRLKQIRMIGINPRQLEQTRNIQRRSWEDPSRPVQKSCNHLVTWSRRATTKPQSKTRLRESVCQMRNKPLLI